MEDVLITGILVAGFVAWPGTWPVRLGMWIRLKLFACIAKKPRISGALK